MKKSNRNPKTYDDWVAKLRDCKKIWDDYQAPFGASDQSPLRPERLMQGLANVIPENAIFATDVGVHHNWVVQLWKARRARHLLQSWGFASMGFATCGILGAKLAQPESPAIAVVGDGSFLMTPHILATAMEYDIPAVWVVWNNYGYCSIRDMQLGMFGQEHATSFRKEKPKNFSAPDFVMLARSMGVEARARRSRGRSRRRARNRDQGQQAVSRGSPGRPRYPSGRHRHLVPAADTARRAELQEAGGTREIDRTHRASQPHPFGVRRCGARFKATSSLP